MGAEITGSIFSQRKEQHQPQIHHTLAAAMTEFACHVLALSANSEPALDVDNALNLRLQSQAKQKTFLTLKQISSNGC